ncbi:hypothetical protein [Actinoplanes sp. NPDC026619]|uniref:hypothetical protein n=1 Tax=Actinoplanes sp. NPDC026619 TaxID=3155798 RepID=UPI0033FB5766
MGIIHDDQKTIGLREYLDVGWFRGERPVEETHRIPTLGGGVRESAEQPRFADPAAAVDQGDALSVV